MREASRGVLAQDAMITRYEALGPGSRVEDAVECLIRTTQHEFPVVDAAGRLQGMLTRDEMIKALKERGPDAPVREVMRTDIPLVDQRRSLDEALRPMQERKLPAVGLVDREGRFVGFVTPENVGELMMVQAARGGRRPGLPWRPGGSRAAVGA
jgi:CBS domain-containing protein